MDKRCYRTLKAYPTEPCGLGKNLFDKNVKKCDKCPWGVLHEASNYCFFKYIAENDFDHTPKEVAQLLQLTVQRAGQLERIVLIKLKRLKILKEFIGEAPKNR